jgi:predicted deacylase
VIVLILVAIVVGVFIIAGPHQAPPVVQPLVETKAVSPIHSVIGQSVQGRNIDAYTYGIGTTHLMFVGGIHGGYEWNSVILAYTFMDYLDANPDLYSSNSSSSPASLTITVIPSANPDAVYSVVGKEGRFTAADVSTSSKVLTRARFNADDVDLNRNFDCKWQPKSTWQSKTVSAGKSAFSEPEAAALRDYIESFHPDATIFWHSQSNAVYASQCKDGILPVTLDIMNAYSKASGYPAVKTFDAYTTTGAADDWMASIGMPAITVELKTHDTIEWSRNLAGIKSFIGYFEKK